MNTAQKKPLSLAAEGAMAKICIDGCLQYMAFSCQSQAQPPISWLIRSNFIENLVSQPFTAKRSLKVDGLLVFSEFLKERCGHGWN